MNHKVAKTQNDRSETPRFRRVARPVRREISLHTPTPAAHAQQPAGFPRGCREAPRFEGADRATVAATPEDQSVGSRPRVLMSRGPPGPIHLRNLPLLLPSRNTNRRRFSQSIIWWQAPRSRREPPLGRAGAPCQLSRPGVAGCLSCSGWAESAAPKGSQAWVIARGAWVENPCAHPRLVRAKPH